MYKLGSLIIGIVLPYILFWLAGVGIQMLDLENMASSVPRLVTPILVGSFGLGISWPIARVLSKKEPQVFSLRMMSLGIFVTAACWLLILPLLEV